MVLQVLYTLFHKKKNLFAHVTMVGMRDFLQLLFNIDRHSQANITCFWLL